MIVNFVEALRQINAGGRNRVLTFAREARTPATYLGGRYLPEMLRPDYQAKTGSMTIRTTMAGLVGMDSPYPEGGAIEFGTFDEQTAKIAIRQRFPEQLLRQLQLFVATLQLNGGNGMEAVVNAVVDFTDKLLIQPHLDRTEWLRWQALTTGAIDWTFNQKRLQVDYGFPAEHLPASRTSNDRYGGSSSKFWTDHQTARRLLKGNVREIVAHPDTVDQIIYNSANSLQVVNYTNDAVTFQRIVGTTERPSTDARETIRIVMYGLEAEVMDPANPGRTDTVPFVAPGKLVYIANNTGSRFEIGAGSTAPVENTLGWVHVGPTVEGNGVAGRWADVRTPDEEPWSLEGRSASNILPVIDNPNKVVTLTTAMA